MRAFYLAYLLTTLSASVWASGSGQSLCGAIMGAQLNFFFQGASDSTNVALRRRAWVAPISGEQTVFQGTYLGVGPEGVRIHVVGIGETTLQDHPLRSDEFTFNVSNAQLVESFFKNTGVYAGSFRLPVHFILQDGTKFFGLASPDPDTGRLRIKSYEHGEIVYVAYEEITPASIRAYREEAGAMGAFLSQLPVSTNLEVWAEVQSENCVRLRKGSFLNLDNDGRMHLKVSDGEVSIPLVNINTNTSAHGDVSLRVVP